MNIPLILIAAIESAFNRYLSLDPESSQKLETLEGKVIELHITGLNVRLFLFPSAAELMILEQYDGEADTIIAGAPLAFASLALSDDKRARMFEGDIVIRGDVRLAQQFNNIFAQLDIDWEELAANYLGDTVAHQLSTFGNRLKDWCTRNFSSINADAGEYLQEEVHYVPSDNEVELFNDDVDEMRNDIARLEARLKKLEQHKQQEQS